MREQFEKLPEIAKYLKYTFFNSETGGYCNNSDNPIPLDFASYLNGAWMMYQEMQREKDLIDERIAYAVKHIGKTNETSIRVLQGILK